MDGRNWPSAKNTDLRWRDSQPMSCISTVHPMILKWQVSIVRNSQNNSFCSSFSSSFSFGALPSFSLSADFCRFGFNLGLAQLLFTRSSRTRSWDRAIVAQANGHNVQLPNGEWREAFAIEFWLGALQVVLSSNHDKRRVYETYILTLLWRVDHCVMSALNIFDVWTNNHTKHRNKAMEGYIKIPQKHLQRWQEPGIMISNNFPLRELQLYHNHFCIAAHSLNAIIGCCKCSWCHGSWTECTRSFCITKSIVGILVELCGNDGQGGRHDSWI